MKKKPNKWSRNIDRIPIQGPRFEIEQKKPETVIYKCQWEFHQNDADSIPPVSHGHAVGKHLKLELWSGKVCQGKSKKPCGRAKLMHEAWFPTPDLAVSSSGQAVPCFLELRFRTAE